MSEENNFFDLRDVPANIGGKRGSRGSTKRDIKDLVDIVGSKRGKEIYVNPNFQSERAFNHWQYNEKYPARKDNYTAGFYDLDGDKTKEFIVLDTRGDDPIPIAVNGFSLRQSKFPLRYYYSEAYPTREDRKGHNMNDWLREELGIHQDPLSLKRTIDKEKAKKSKFYKYVKEHPTYSGLSGRWSEKIPPYRHFVSYVFKSIVHSVKQQIAEELKNQIPSEIVDMVNKSKKYELADVITVGKVELLLKIASGLWNDYFLTPILNNESAQTLLKQYIQRITQEEQNEKQKNNQHKMKSKDEIKKAALTRLKARKWFKDNLARIYTAWISNKERLNKDVNAMIKLIYNKLKDQPVSLSVSTINRLREKPTDYDISQVEINIPDDTDWQSQLSSLETDALLESDDEDNDEEKDEENLNDSVIHNNNINNLVPPGAPKANRKFITTKPKQ